MVNSWLLQGLGMMGGLLGGGLGAGVAVLLTWLTSLGQAMPLWLAALVSWHRPTVCLPACAHD